MIQYVWSIWSLIMLGFWLGLYLLKKNFRKMMLPVSLATMLFGFTEPLFVSEYWFPPSLFNLAEKTGFDIESLIFSFAIGGIAVVLYRLLFPVTEISITKTIKMQRRHRLHRIILWLPVLLFLVFSMTTGLNHIYCGIISLFTGSLATLYCRPDLKRKIWIGGLLFTLLYFIYFGSILVFFSGYVKAYWNLNALTGVLILGIPMEELLFAFSFGMYWSGLYEHIYWYGIREQRKRESIKMYNSAIMN